MSSNLSRYLLKANNTVDFEQLAVRKSRQMLYVPNSSWAHKLINARIDSNGFHIRFD